jgi:hypothetical protein
MKCLQRRVQGYPNRRQKIFNQSVKRFAAVYIIILNDTVIGVHEVNDEATPKSIRTPSLRAKRSNLPFSRA